MTIRMPGRHRLPRSTSHFGRRVAVGASVVAAVTAAGVGLGGGTAFSANPVSQATARYLSGAALSTDLNGTLSVAPASAANSGSPASVTDVHPLTVSALNAVDVNVGGGVNLLGTSGLLALGAVNQYAQANADGSSQSASGAITNAGAIGIGVAGVPQSSASFTLDGLLPAAVTGAVANLALDVGAAAATASQAAGAAGAQSGASDIATLALNITTPALAGVTNNLATALAALQPTVSSITAIVGADSVLCPFPALCLVAVTGIPDLAAMVGALGVVTSADGSIAADLQTGSISIDVARILTTAGLDLHSLPANTDLVPLITGALASQLLPAVSSALTGLIDQVTSSIGSIAITVASIPLPLGAVTALLAPLLTSVTAPIFTSISGLGASVVSPLGGALTQVLSLEANVQDTVAGVFTERALRVGLLPAASPAAAVVDLASASVGPNNGPAAVVAPTATGLTPDHGPAGGGTSVTVSGSAFVSGQTSVTIGGLTVPASGVTVNGAGTSLTFVTPAHPAGPVSVTATTPAGTTAPLAYTYDPGGNGGIPAPVITTPVDGSTVATATPPIGGTGVAGDTVTVSEGGVTVCSALVGLNSTWSCVPGAPLASGNHTVIATQAAPAAASSGPSNAVTFTVVLPASVPTVSGVHPSHGPAAGHTTVTVTGAAFVVGQTSITIGGIAVPASAVTVNAAGTSLTFATPSHEPGPVDVTTTTPAGTSRPQAYTYDPVPPPVITSPADGSTVATPTPPIEGTGTAGDIVTVTENGNVVCTATAGSNGRWQCTPAAPLDNGKHTIVATQTDVAGHVSDPSSTVTFTVTAIVAVARPGLPNTGTNVVGPLVVGGVLLASGIALLVAMGRRRAG